MLDIRFIRENADIIKAGAAKKHIKVDIDKLLAVDDERKRLRQELDIKRAEQNRRSGEIQRATGVEKEKLLEAMRQLKKGMEEGEEKLKKVMIEWQKLMLMVPNIPDMSVPDGAGEEDNVEVQTWGEKPSFDFPAKDHIELMMTLDMVDFERGVKAHGFRGYFLKKDGAELSWALWNYGRDFYIKKKLRTVRRAGDSAPGTFLRYRSSSERSGGPL